MSWKKRNGLILNDRSAVLAAKLIEKGVVVYDTFDRADNPSTLGISDTGQAWQQLTGIMGILTNKAYTPTTAPLPRACIESGLADCRITAVIAKQCVIVFRVQDLNNRLSVAFNPTTGISAYRIVNGTATSFAGWAGTISDGSIVKVVMSGSNIEIYVNDALYVSATEATHATQTKHGIGLDSTDARIDNFSVEAI